jgi:Tfp pilus assembly PilM family ATPase
LEATPHGLVPTSFAEVAVPAGVMEQGHIIHTEKFVAFISDIRKNNSITDVHIAVREPRFVSPFAATSSKEKPSPVPQGTAAKKHHAHYTNAFVQAGFTVRSFEYDSQALARAIVPSGETGSSLIADIGATDTTVIITSRGMVVYTAPIVFGGTSVIDALTDELGISIEEAHAIKREHGLSASGAHKDIFCAMEAGISVLRDDIAKHYIGWHASKKKLGIPAMIDRIYLSGEYGSLIGLAEYLSASLKMPVVVADPWINCLSYEQVIPMLSTEESLNYAAAIGAALHHS